MNNIIRYYNQFDEWGRLDREPLEFIINWHYMRRYLPAHGHILDNGAGPGKYAIALAEIGYEVTLTDLTPKLVEFAEYKAEELALTEQFRGFHITNAVDLTQFPNEQFDASLMLGPLYHLQLDKQRDAAAQELYRVTKSGGIVFVAFKTRTRHLMTALADPKVWKPNDNMIAIQTFIETGIFNHTDEGRFTGVYYFNTEDIKPFMESHGFESIKLIGSSSAAGSLNIEQLDYWRSLGEEQYEMFMQMLFKEAEDPYLLGSSSHLLYIGRKM